MNYEDEDLDDDFEDKIWYRDYKCPECGNEEEVECNGKYAPIHFCSNCGCQMNQND